jgi:hypothetical protein
LQRTNRKGKKRTKKSDSIQDLLSVAEEENLTLSQKVELRPPMLLKYLVFIFKIQKPKRNARKKLKFSELHSETDEDESIEQNPKRIDLKSSETIEYVLYLNPTI